MYAIETSDKHLNSKINAIYDSINGFFNLLGTPIKEKKISQSKLKYLSQIKNKLEHYYDMLKNYEKEYSLCMANIFSEYYLGIDEEKLTRKYHIKLISNNFVNNIHTIAINLKNELNTIYNILVELVSVKKKKLVKISFDDVYHNLEYAINVKIDTKVKKDRYEICSCGKRMIVVPESSELHCECGEIKQIIGAVFRDDQFYTQEGQKSKHNGYDTSRHYKFWMERLQALESKTIEQKDLDNIRYVIERDQYTRKELTCEIMRSILKDPKVSATYLNDHVALLVKTFGGPTPPRLSYKENRLCAIRFNKVMKLYDIVNPDSGNKPYYPYFIYKILEQMFKNDKKKIKILDSIHLQSRDTVIKNDKYFHQICEISTDRGLIYTPTDPAGRL